MCGATNLGEALRRIGEGAAMIRSKGEAGTGDIVEAVRHLRMIRREIRRLTMLDDAELATAAKELQAPLHLVRQIAADGRLPVVLFCAGGIATPADAALVMQLGAEGVFVGSGIFKSEDPERRARAIVEATTHYQDPARVAAASTGLGQPMVSLETPSSRPSSCWRRAAGSAWRRLRRRAQAWSASSPCRATSRPTRRSSARSAQSPRGARRRRISTASTR